MEVTITFSLKVESAIKEMAQTQKVVPKEEFSSVLEVDGSMTLT
jgi:hypothetical protein